MKIVSLLPSATEVLYAMGLEEFIVGLSHDCDYPPEVRRKPVVSTSSVNDKLSSAEIDEAVGQTYHNGGSIYHIDPAFLRRERPDLIIAQELCQVCAVTSAEAKRAAALARSGARVLSLEPSTLGQTIASIRLLGEAVGRKDLGDALAAEMERFIAEVRAQAEEAKVRPRALCLGWLEPLIIEGHWVPEMVAMAGGEDGLGAAGGHSRRIGWEEVTAYAPEVLFLMPCSFSLNRTLAEAHVLGKLPGWEELPAVRSGRVYATDSGYFSRPGPRLATGLTMLARCLHPELFTAPLPPGSTAQLAEGSRPIRARFQPLV